MKISIAQVLAKSLPKLEGLHPILASATRAWIEMTYGVGVPIIITQGLRTIEYQNELYAKGRTAPGPIVTNAKGGSSYHNYGLAVDFALLDWEGNRISYDTWRDLDRDGQRDWFEAVNIAKDKLNLEWGGEFKTIHDEPHFQMSFGLSIAELRSGKRPAVTNPPAFTLVNITVNGKTAPQGRAEKGITWVRLRDIGTALGATISYDATTKKAMLNGKVVDGKAENGVTWIPLRNLLDAIGAEYTYDNEIKTVAIISHR